MKLKSHLSKALDEAIGMLKGFNFKHELQHHSDIFPVLPVTKHRLYYEVSALKSDLDCETSFSSEYMIYLSSTYVESTGTPLRKQI